MQIKLLKMHIVIKSDDGFMLFMFENLQGSYRLTPEQVQTEK